jgi:tetratricopeptide (TPR) repeat protein
MGLLLCGRRAEHPFYYEKLDTNIWSIQELSYVIVHYPIIIPRDFVDRKLTNWIRDELHMGMLASRLEQYMGSGEGTDIETRLLLMILRDANYYKETEIVAFEAGYRRLRNVDKKDFLELLGDTFFRMERYGRAIEAYEDALRNGALDRVKQKLGAGYVSVMQFRKASDIFEESFVETNKTEPLRKLYFIHKLEPSVNTIEKYENSIDTEVLAGWEKEYNAVLKQAESSDRMEKVTELYDTDREEFRRQAKLLLLKWKKEYRDRV